MFSALNIACGRRIIIIMVLLTWSPYLTEAQSAHPSFFHYTTEDGLPSSECYDIIQDQKGYIWISTDNGVSRFDGYEFKNYGTEEGLLDKTVLFIKEDHRGWIWLSTFSGNFYILRGDTIAAYPHNELLQNIRNEYYCVDQFSVDDDGGLFVSLMGYNLARISQEGVFELLEYPFALQGYNSIIIPQQGQQPFYVAKFMAGYDPQEIQNYRTNFWEKDRFRIALFQEDRQYTYVFPASLKDRILSEGGVHSFLSATEDGLLIQHFDSLYLITEPLENDFIIGRSGNHINSLLSLPDGSYYAGYNLQQGLAYYESIDQLLAEQPTYQAMAGHTVSHLTKDKQGGLWIATTNNGIFYAASTENPSVQIIRPNTGNDLACIVAHPPDKLFVAQSSGQIYQLDPLLNVKKHSLVGDYNSINDLAWFDDQFLLTAPLKRWENGKWTNFFRYVPINDRIEGVSLKSLIPSSRKNHFWGIRSTRGLTNFRLDNNGIKVAVEYPLTQNNKITALAEDQNQTVWVGTMDGFFQLDRSSRQLNEITGHKIYQERVEDICPLPDGSIAVATRGSGIYVIRPDTLIVWSTANGLSSNTVPSLSIRDGVLWAATSEGLNRIPLAQGIKGNYIFNKKNGLPSNEVLGLAFLDQHAYVLTNNAVTKIMKDLLPEVPEVPIHIQAIKVGGESKVLADLAQLSWRDNSLQITYNYLDYSQQGKVGYRFRLNDQTAWINTNNNSLDLLNLNPGEYQLEIQAKDQTENWVAAAPMLICIASPFWQSIWFIGLCVLGAILVAYWLFSRRLYTLAQEQDRISLQEQVKQLKQQAYRAQMNPHFIFNCMSTIQGMIIGGHQEQDRAIRMVASFSQLIRSALEFSEQEAVTLKDELSLLRNYLALEKIRFNNNFNYTIEVDPTIETDWLEVPPMLVQPFIENAVLHGMEKKKGDGKILIRYQLEEKLLMVSVIDNGPGISSTKALKAKNPSKYQHKSLGMTITQRRLAMLNPTGYQLEIEEPRNEEGQICGTIIRLRIPVE